MNFKIMLRPLGEFNTDKPTNKGDGLHSQLQ